MMVSGDSAMEALRARFTAAWEAVGGTDAEGAFRGIVARYGEGRSYHDIGHIVAMFGMLEEVMPGVAVSPELTIAVFLHDAVYDPREHDNEWRSAELARELLPGAAVATVERIARLIAATERHESGEPEAQLLIDLDLCFLGLEASVFEANVEKLVWEFGHLERAQFLRGQAGYLKPFLARQHIYYTEPFRRRFEATARANLERFIVAHRESA